MRTHRTSVLTSLLLLVSALMSGPALAVAAMTDDAQVGGSCGFGAPERPQLNAARDQPERLHTLTVAGNSDPVTTPLPRPAAKSAETVVLAAAGSPPLFLVHCAFLC